MTSRVSVPPAASFRIPTLRRHNDVWLALVAGAVVGLATIFYETAAAQHVPREAFSRVMAYDWFGSLALQPLGLILIGPVAAGVGTSTTLWGIAAILLLCQLAVVAVPSVRRLEARPDRPHLNTASGRITAPGA